MALTLLQTMTAITPGVPVSFLATGGVSPYVYTVVPGGAGGSINASTGVYTSPLVANSDPKKSYDTIRVTDSAMATATAIISVITPLLLVCDIIQKELALPAGRVYLWDQKKMQPTDSGLYIVVACTKPKAFANNLRLNASGESEAYVSMAAQLDINIISRDISALNRKEELLLAFNSIYAQQQQAACGFYLATLPISFVNISEGDGAAIPYRYVVSVNMQYAVSKTKAVEYFDEFEAPEITTDA